jgi:hypothetical protein
MRPGRVRLSGNPWGDTVIVPYEYLKSVGFIVERIPGSCGTGPAVGDLIGTGFFVRIPGTLPTSSFTAFVTAKHLIRDLNSEEPLLFAVNAKGGEGVVYLTGIGPPWYPHPTDSTADVVVMPVNLQHVLPIQAGMEAGVFPIHIDLFVPRDVNEINIGLGDDVFMPGLFNFAPGNSRMTPLLRYGNLAMVPDGPIQVESSFADVYLTEARSIGGISGSPVFIRPTAMMKATPRKSKEADYLVGFSTQTYLLGLSHGHWDIRESDLNAVNFIHDRQRGVNLGISVVVPAYKILETLNHPALVELRGNAEKEYSASISPTKD